MPEPRAPQEARRLPRALSVSLQVLAWVVVALSAVAIGLARWTLRTFGSITPDQALLNLRGAGQEGGGGSELIVEAVVASAVIPLALVSLVCGGFYFLRRRVVRRNVNQKLSSHGFAAALTVLAVAMPVAGAGSIDSALQVRQYIASSDPSLDVGAYYVQPERLEQPSGDKPNLVLIYLESIEDTFQDEGLFGVDMLADLTRATENWDTIDALEQYPGGGWTMSGIVSTQCGVPLRSSSASGVTSTDTTDQAGVLNKFQGESYMAGAQCLGDVLAENGYQNVYLGGARAAFAGKGSFLTTHGYDKVLDLEHWDAQGEVEKSERWGLSDRRLLENAKSEILSLRESGEPFNLTMLTLDSHEPAHLFPYCEPVSDLDTTSVTTCSMNVVADFVTFLEYEGFLDDTVVVVMGDHLKFPATANSYFEELTSTENRTIFNRISVPSELEIKEATVDQLGVYPTILDALGFQLQDGQAGLGVSAFHHGIPIQSLRSLNADEYETIIRSRSQDFYDALWGLDTLVAQPPEQ
ncbi:sulfatase-like hydrolase/transferase [Schaalia sp. JY-X169]|uniref:sulfatase-like hydrolase/transferase n=1 Tax=Schaalia sp. JY-X169 TaxID=2758572 RepID=UPI0015F53EDE|nr:sulfatase-like hydrolase/transferase [Schaalia sp. JY-X169]